VSKRDVLVGRPQRPRVRTLRCEPRAMGGRPGEGRPASPRSRR
jgi:hypothetical protein